MSDAPVEKCPSCNNKLRRLVSGGTGLIFKGSGFYLTDYSKNNSKKTDESVKNSSKNKPTKNKE
jgi:predicted nucleic acid-binding Zn ribbon protein